MMSITDEIIKEIKEKESLAEYWDFKNNDRRNHVHSMMKYPAVMVPNMQGEIFDLILKHDNNISNVLDPFMGSGTILVEGLLRGIDVFGIDINPLSYLITLAKTQKYNTSTLRKKTIELLERIQMPYNYELYSFEGINKWYNNEVISELSKIRAAILQEKDLRYRRLYWVTFAEIAKQADNSRTSTFKLHIKMERDLKKAHYSCFENFKYKLAENVSSIIEFHQLRIGKAGNINLKYGDSIKILRDKRVFKSNSIDLVITSPPYGDNATTIPYGQYSVLPLRWIPLSDISSKINESIIESLSQIDRESLGGKKYSILSIKESRVFHYSQAFSTLYGQLISEMQLEKAQKVASFIMDFDIVLNELYDIIKPGKFMVFTVGNRQVNKLEVPFDKILSELSEHYGFEIVYDFRRNILKNKIYTDTKAQNFKTIKKETIIVLRKAL